MDRQTRSLAASRPGLSNALSAAMACACLVLCVALTLPAMAASVGGASARGTASRTASSRSAPSAHTVSTPVTFEPNVGQDASAAPFIAHLGGGTTMAPSPTGATISVGSGPTQSRVSLDLVDAGSGAISGRDKQAGIANYFSGSDPSRWHTNVPMYGEVVTDNAYPGISLVWRSSGSGVE